MTQKKTLSLPYVYGLDKTDNIESLFSLLSGATEGHGNIDTVNWQDAYPYRPECSFMAGWCKTGIGILYSVSGMDLRAVALEDNGHVWEDSCCEFFVSDPTDGTYYNFEMNCIGTLLAAKRKSRTDCRHFSAEQLGKIKRFSTLKHESIDRSNEPFSWKVGLFIPFTLIGISEGRIPAELQANFYKCGDLTAHVHFLSWSPISTENPDFHRPEFFGTLKLKKEKKLIFKALSPALLTVYAVILIGLCFWKFSDIPESTKFIFGIPTDKVVHFCMFFPLVPLMYSTFVRKNRGSVKSVLAIVGLFFLGCIVAGGTEIGQSLTDYRSCDIADFRADALSIALSTVLILVIDLAKRKHSRS